MSLKVQCVLDLDEEANDLSRPVLALQNAARADDSEADKSLVAILKRKKAIFDVEVEQARGEF